MFMASSFPFLCMDLSCEKGNGNASDDEISVFCELFYPVGYYMTLFHYIKYYIIYSTIRQIRI